MAILCVAAATTISSKAHAGWIMLEVTNHSTGETAVSYAGDFGYQSQSLDIWPNQDIEYTWSADGVVGATSFYKINNGTGYDFCIGNRRTRNYGGVWAAQGNYGNTTSHADNCMAEKVYNVHYYGTDAQTGQRLEVLYNQYPHYSAQ